MYLLLNQNTTFLPSTRISPTLKHYHSLHHWLAPH